MSWIASIRRNRYVFAADVLALSAAFALAYLLRFDFRIPPSALGPALRQLPFIVALEFAAMALCGIYALVWRYIGMRDLKLFIMAALLAHAPVLLLRLTLPDRWGVWRVPFSVIAMNIVLALGATVGLRVVRRAAYERSQQKSKTTGAAKAVLVIGAGREGRVIAEEIRYHQHDIVVSGFVDDDPNKQQSTIQGLKVLGATGQLPALVEQHAIDHVIIAISQASQKDYRRILDICERIPVKARVVPSLHELVDGTLRVTQIRDLEIEDLLGRAPAQWDNAESKGFFAGKVVMVTGAGGSIGSELARQAAALAPSRLLLVERAEPALFKIDGEMRDAYPQQPITPVLADAGNRARMQRIFAEFRPHVVLHAGAHKHVPLTELNACEAVSNNVFGTQRLGELAGEYGADVFVLVSTDKAVRPSSIMGATKRLAELVIQALNQRYTTRFVAVRLGNVIGSAGSVIPIFQAQVRKGGPVTVTHPDMVRYFMTIPEASQLILEATALGEGGEIFILDMGEPVQILNLAKDVISLSGLKPFEDVDIVFTGIRPGEKIREELKMSGDSMSPTRHKKIFVGKITPPAGEIQAALDEFERLIGRGDEEGVKRLLAEVVPESTLLMHAFPGTSE